MRAPAGHRRQRLEPRERRSKAASTRRSQAAKAADVVLLAIGEGENMSGEAQSRTESSCPNRNKNSPKPWRRPANRSSSCSAPDAHWHSKGAVRNADAILVTWFLGSESGNAHRRCPVRRLQPIGVACPSAFRIESGQQPYFYNHRSTGRPLSRQETPAFKARYREAPNEALYPFGHGLGYSKFTYRRRKSAAKSCRGTASSP